MGKYVSIMGYVLGLYKDDGKEHGNYYSILGLYRDSGAECGIQNLCIHVPRTRHTRSKNCKPWLRTTPSIQGGGCKVVGVK